MAKRDTFCSGALGALQHFHRAFPLLATGPLTRSLRLPRKASGKSNAFFVFSEDGRRGLVLSGGGGRNLTVWPPHG